MQCTNEFICPSNSVAKGESSILVGTNCQRKFYCCFSNFRMYRSTLCNELRSAISKTDTDMRPAIPVEKKSCYDPPHIPRTRVEAVALMVRILQLILVGLCLQTQTIGQLAISLGYQQHPCVRYAEKFVRPLSGHFCKSIFTYLLTVHSPLF